MVGLSILLEGFKDINKESSHHHHQVISKASMMIKPSSPTLPYSPNPFSKRNSFNLSSSSSTSINGFLDHCFLCKQKLLPSKDIYMYKGDKAFCSEECRCRQIFMDEEESMKAKTDHCSMAAASSSRSASSRKGTKNRANGFAY